MNASSFLPESQNFRPAAHRQGRLLASLVGALCLTACATSQPSGAGDRATVTNQQVAIVQQGHSGTDSNREATGRTAFLRLEPTARDAEIARLRREGPEGLDALLGEHRPEVAALLRGESDGELDRIRAAIERVSMQRDGHVSQLYWHTDLDRAKARSLNERKPILSLRMLGRLDEELSCANSRFFRTLLYSNEPIRQHLRKHYVLHWSSERPVPVATIDFGDGRKLKTTITGNSIHYLLDHEGRPFDAIVGLVGPNRFLRRLMTITHQSAPVMNRGRNSNRDRYVYNEILRQDREWARLIRSAGLPANFGYPANVRAAGVRGAKGKGGPQKPRPGRNSKQAFPSAGRAVPIAVGKAMIEAPMIKGIQGRVFELPKPGSGRQWGKLIDLERQQTRFDDRSLALMALKQPVGIRTTAASQKRLLSDLRKAVAEDSLRNAFGLRRQVLNWLTTSTDLQAVNRRVYSELFLTPRADPWLGLGPTHVYNAIERGGVLTTAGPRGRGK